MVQDALKQFRIK